MESIVKVMSHDLSVQFYKYCIYRLRNKRKLTLLEYVPNWYALLFADKNLL